jgi:hypothetical protein
MVGWSYPNNMMVGELGALVLCRYPMRYLRTVKV